MKFLLITALALTSSFANAVSIAVKFTYDFSTYNGCNGAVVLCVDHFDVLDITDDPAGILLWQITAPNTAASSVDFESEQLLRLPIGSPRTISVVAVGFDAGGVAASSDLSAQLPLTIVKGKHTHVN